MINKFLDAVRTLACQVFGRQTERQMRPPFDGVEVLRHRFKGPAQSLQFLAKIDHIRHIQTN